MRLAFSWEQYGKKQVADAIKESKKEIISNIVVSKTFHNISYLILNLNWPTRSNLHFKIIDYFVSICTMAIWNMVDGRIMKCAQRMLDIINYWGHSLMITVGGRIVTNERLGLSLSSQSEASWSSDSGWVSGWWQLGSGGSGVINTGLLVTPGTPGASSDVTRKWGWRGCNGHAEAHNK